MSWRFCAENQSPLDDYCVFGFAVWQAFSKNSADTSKEPAETRDLPKFTATPYAMPQSYLQERLEQLARVS